MKTFFGTKAWWAYLFILHFISPLLSPFLFLINLFVYEKWYIWIFKILSFVLNFLHYIVFHCFCLLSFYIFWYPSFLLRHLFVWRIVCLYGYYLCIETCTFPSTQSKRNAWKDKNKKHAAAFWKNFVYTLIIF